MKPELIPAARRPLEQFCQPFGQDGEHYVVRIEELQDGGYAISFGIYPELTKYPKQLRKLMKKEAVWLLGRLLGQGFDYRMPDDVKESYKEWLLAIEQNCLARY